MKKSIYVFTQILWFKIYLSDCKPNKLKEVIWKIKFNSKVCQHQNIVLRQLEGTHQRIKVFYGDN